MKISRSLAKSFLWRLVAAIISGGLLASAFPPLSSAEAAWFALIPLLLICRFSKPFSSFRWGFFAGLIFWLFTLSWLMSLTNTWAGPSIVVYSGWVLLSCYCALYFGAFSMVVSLLWKRVQDSLKVEVEGESKPVSKRAVLVANLWMIFIIPLLWVGFEYLRSTLLTGFPWNALGISQYLNIPMIQIAEWLGVYGVSAVIMVVNVSFAITVLRLTSVFTRIKRRTRFNVELMVGLAVWLLFMWYGTVQIRFCRNEDTSTYKKMRIAAIQPNIEQLKKWDNSIVDEIYNQLTENTKLALLGNPDMVIWPETALPESLGDRYSNANFLIRTFTTGGPLLLTGVLEFELEPRKDGSLKNVSYNSSLLFGAQGTLLKRYRKQHLVPFGEYVPFDKKFSFIEKLAPLEFTCTPGDDNVVFYLGNNFLKYEEAIVPSIREKERAYAFSVLICFEDIMPYISRNFVKKGARFLVNQTNDAWFDGSCASVQHMSHCVFRCVENRVEAVRCANTGVTCFISRTGMLDRTTRHSLRNNETGFINYRTENITVMPKDMALTFYTRFGDIPFALPAGIVAAVSLVFVIWHERKKKVKPLADAA